MEATGAVRRRNYCDRLRFAFRRGLRANHQMLAIVTSTPRPAAGLAILRERSDMAPTLPGPARGRDPVRRALPQPRLAGSDRTTPSAQVWVR